MSGDTGDIYVRNWHRWQSYRKDRGTPPWIKIYRNLLSNPDWARLTDGEKGQLISIWIVAADKCGKIVADPSLLKKMCMLDNPPDINKLVDLGFLTTKCHPNDDQMTTKCLQRGAPETEIEVEAETEEETEAAYERPKWILQKDWDDLLSHRLRKKAHNTARALSAIVKQLDIARNAGHSSTECIDTMISRDWVGFNADWMGHLNRRRYNNGQGTAIKAEVDKMIDGGAI